MTTVGVQSTWDTRDLPFLRAAAALIEDGDDGPFFSGDLAEETGLSPKDCGRAARALCRADYLDGKSVGGMGSDVDTWMIDAGGITERGRRTVGLWPAEEGADALVAAMQDVARHTSDPEQAGRLRRAADAIGGMTRDVAVELAAAYAARVTGAA